MIWLCRVWVMDWDRAERSASFSGFGGMGGGVMFADVAGRVMSNGESRRFTGGGLGCGAGLGWTGCCWYWFEKLRSGCE